MEAEEAAAGTSEEGHGAVEAQEALPRPLVQVPPSHTPIGYQNLTRFFPRMGLYMFVASVRESQPRWSS